MKGLSDQINEFFHGVAEKFIYLIEDHAELG